MKIVLICSWLLLSGLVNAVNTNYATPEYLDKLLISKDYKEFCKLLDIDVTMVQSSSTDQHWYDVVYRPWQLQRNQRGYMNIKKWKNSEVPYSASNNFTIAEQGALKRAIWEWNKRVSKVKYRPWRSTDTDYVFIFKGKKSWSQVGRAGGQQGLSLQSLSKGTVLHEMMHAVGIPHEQQRTDRDRYIRPHLETLPEHIRRQYDKYLVAGWGPPSRYDYLSLMHYPPVDNGRRVFEILDATVSARLVGRSTTFTKKDLWNIQRLYAGEPGPSL